MTEQDFRYAARRAAQVTAQIAQLQKLVAEWRQHSAERGLENSPYHLGIAHGYKQCATALADILCPPDDEPLTREPDEEQAP